ncbi:type II toxin-antitoxin system RelB/DinJ family antitoxin [Streptococcus thoraltensis]|uniref:type II toxin-antitoxin system RelB/DinJ family antitoxin n=1 Tax=Streptococcus thoraltensis TaxID=55085 RepID=UPI001F5A2301|nr:type II toxin-antitoxin system RelB/DinJ family antitoxin [Streptococcus thoraltensis]
MATISFRVDEELKKEAAALYQGMGLDLSSALKLFLVQSVVTRKIPFEIKADELHRIVDDSVTGTNMSASFSDVDSLMESLNA